jgi:hypothetical protein
MVDHGQAQGDEHVQVNEQAQVEGQGEDQNGGDDQGFLKRLLKKPKLIV